MILEQNKQDFFFSKLSQFKVEDKNGKNIGKPGDALFSKKDLSIDSLILFGGILEEKLEDLHMKENIDPIVPLSSIASIDEKGKKIVLKVAKEDLKSTNNAFVTPDGMIQYIKLKKLPIFEKGNENIGRVIDIHFLKQGGYKFIVGGSALEEFLEKVRVIPDKDLIIPASAVTEISDKIQIKLHKTDLLSTLEDTPENKDPKELLTNERAGFYPRGMNF